MGVTARVALVTLCSAYLVVNVYARLNVLFIVVDDLRPQLSCYGYPNMVTPNIDNFATKSVTFERAYVQQGVCSPSRTSFMTGRRPDTTHVFDLKTYFRNTTGNFSTIPEYFKNNGYISQSSGKIFHPGIASGKTDDYPASWSFPAYHAPTEKYAIQKVCPGSGGTLYRTARCPVNVTQQPGGSLPDIQNADFAIQFLQNRSEDQKPFFLGMGFMKPHLPFRFPIEYLDLYPLSKVAPAPNPNYPLLLPEVAWSPWPELRVYDDIVALNVSFPYGPVPPEYALLLRQAYSAAVTYIDAQVGRIMAALDTLGLANNTIVTFHGDHGWQLGEHQEWCKHDNFEITTRVPMFVYIPGTTAPKAPPGQLFPFFDPFEALRSDYKAPAMTSGRLSTDALVEAVDLFATLSELAGLPVPPLCPPDSSQVELCTEGYSLVPLIRNLTTSPSNSSFQWKSAAFSQYPRPSATIQHNSDLPNLDDIRIMGYTMRTDEHRYTEWVAYDPVTFTANWTQVYARELYVHSSDPEENYNVADAPLYTQLLTQLSQQLRRGWRAALPAMAES
ncbi:LOW QUALITY PROTEIN: iduronate 2-sulfatase-like [Pomacea canaliculata]|uniref:LOW QUALITY PROTEIN: iduronate 2-sulfatase-like n=1 Tax=Pomacea canaliculata TaxID=400727 RepID=UPI000D73F8C6|nr:LOW QUALITY PROTEIN: iduronate 2-sulfatase-like [Pomacea canaliculata]